jgi:hypothetical protein
MGQIFDPKTRVWILKPPPTPPSLPVPTPIDRSTHYPGFGQYL